MKSFTAIALEGFPMIKAGDDVAKAIVDSAMENGVKIEDGDVVVIAQKVTSKAERRVFRLKGVIPSAKAEDLAKVTGKDPRLVELVLRETKRVIKVSGEVLLVEDKRGLVCISAGIDKSNVQGGDSFALLPEDPDASAESYRLRIRALAGKNVGVVICDTYSRPFRRAQVNFAIGFAGMRPFRDYRGGRDLFGQVLKVKNIAVVDELAASAELLMGQAKEARPVVIFKGLSDVVVEGEKNDVKDLFISAEEDLFKGAL